MRKKSIQNALVFVLCMAIGFCLAACGGGSYDASYDYAVKNESMSMGAMDSYAEAPMAMPEESIVEDVEIEDTKVTEQKLVYTTDLNIETKEYDDAVTEIKQSVSAMNGYIESTTTYSYSNSRRNTDFTIRVPSSSYKDFLNKICTIGSITYQNENVEDITSQYLDVEARLSSLEDKMERLKELQLEAEDIQTLLTIENQISETQYQLENYTSQLNYMKNKVSYCTLNIHLNEVVVYTEQPTFLSEIAETHKETIEGFVRFLKDFCLFLIRVYPYAISALGATAIILYLKKQNKIKIPKKIKKVREKDENKNIVE